MSAGLAPADDAAVPRAFARLVDAIGSDRFGAQLLEVMRALTGAALCSVFRCDGDAPALVLAEGASAPDPGFALAASRAYLRGYWRADRQLVRQARLPDAKPMVVRRRATDIGDPAYRAACYERAGVAERLSLVWPGTPAFIVSGYRLAGDPGFAAEHLETLERHAALLAATLGQHLRAAEAAGFLADATALAERLAALDCGLSAREAEIAAAMMIGDTQDGIARAKRLAPATIVTYRRRAYGKLGIANRRDLMALHRRLVVDRPGARGTDGLGAG